MKKDATNQERVNRVKKLQLNRETLRALEKSDLKGVQGGASDANSCRPCDTRFGTCLC